LAQLRPPFLTFLPLYRAKRIYPAAQPLYRRVAAFIARSAFKQLNSSTTKQFNIYETLQTATAYCYW
jgi:hypothetical protein